jgi:hypothetical protein
MVEGSGIGGCEVGVNIGGEIGDPTLAVMATATVIGDSAWPVKVVGVADEINTMRAVVV